MKTEGQELINYVDVEVIPGNKNNIFKSAKAKMSLYIAREWSVV